MYGGERPFQNFLKQNKFQDHLLWIRDSKPSFSQWLSIDVPLMPTYYKSSKYCTVSNLFLNDLLKGLS